jgi:hypothetical protein
MAARPMVVNTTIPYGTFTYDGVPNNVILRGTVIDVPAGSALNTALGANITAMSTQQQQPGSSDSINASGVSNLGINGSYTGTGAGTGTAGAGMPFAWPQ